VVGQTPGGLHFPQWLVEEYAAMSVYDEIANVSPS
jgi:hypothetical protein